MPLSPEKRRGRFTLEQIGAEQRTKTGGFIGVSVMLLMTALGSENINSTQDEHGTPFPAPSFALNTKQRVNERKRLGRLDDE